MAAAKGQIKALKKKLASVEKAKTTIEKAKDKVVKAREEAEKAKELAEETKERVEQKAYEIGVAEIETNLKAQVLGVCRLYCSQVGLKPSTKLGLRLYPNLGEQRTCITPCSLRVCSCQFWSRCCPRNGRGRSRQCHQRSCSS